MDAFLPSGPPDLLFHALDALPSGVAMVGSDRRVVLWNRWMARTSGIEAAAAHGRTLDALLPGGSAATVCRAMETILDAPANQVGGGCCGGNPLHAEMLFAARPAAIRCRAALVAIRWPGSAPHCLIRVDRDDADPADLRRANDALDLRLAEQTRDLTRARRALTALGRCNAAALRAETEADLLDEVVRTIVEDAGYLMAWVGFVENDREKSVRPVAMGGIGQSYVVNTRATWADTPSGRGPTGTAVRTGRPSLCHDTLTDPAFTPWRALSERFGFRSVAGLPLRGDDRVFGALMIYAGEANAFDSGEVGLLMDLTANLAYGILARRELAIRHKAEAELRASEARFRSIFDNSAVAITLTDPDGRYVDFNDAWPAMLGYRRDELLGRTVADITVPNDRPENQDARARLLRGEIDSYRMEKRYRRRDGSVLWGDLSISSPLRDDDGRPLLIMGIVQDITERKRAEDEMHAARRRAEDASRAKSEFLANMSHELRTPLHAIQGYARLGADRAATADREQLRRYFERVRAGGTRLLALLNDLLDLSRLDSGRLRFHFEAAELAPLIDRVVSEFSALAQERGIVLRHRRSALPPAGPIVIDSARIAQVLHNLLSNAIRYSRDGGEVTVSCRPADPGEAGGAGYAVTVADRGVGIPDDEIETVFDRFAQSSRTRDGSGGSGLGLAICREIVLAHGGTIRAAANPDGGTRVTFVLPRDRARGDGSENHRDTERKPS